MKIKNYKSFSELFAEDQRENYISELKTKLIKSLSKILSKLNINKKTSVKIYVVTTVILILFLTAMYITINVGYRRYYELKKGNDYLDLVNIFYTDFNKKTNDEERIKFIKDFQNKHYVKVAIFDINMHLKFDGDVKYTSEDNVIISPHASNEAKIAKIVFYDQGYESIQYEEDMASSIIANGIIREISNYYPPYSGGVLYGYRENKAQDINGVLTDYYNIFLISPLQPIDDAISSIRAFFLYFYIASIFVVLIVCIILSRIIAKPLRSINSVAVKMSSFDFSEKCDDKYKDEIGSLAKSLNMLSANLQKSLKKLKEANKMLQDDIEKERNLEKIRKEFVAAVSHDLKTPVSIIQGYAEGIKDGIFEGEEAEYYLDVIIDETNKMNSLIKDMLDLSALEGGNITIKKEKYNISDQLIKSIKNLSTMIKEKDMKFVIRILEDSYVNADYNRIEQVINNLITNAIKYGYEETDIKINLFEDEEGYLNIEVENEGDPISKIDFEKIWTRFYKIDKSRNRNVGGTGLGLAISKNIIQLHNGEIGGYNKDNAIVFYFKLKKEDTVV